MFERVRGLLAPRQAPRPKLTYHPELVSELRFSHRMIEQTIREIVDLHRRDVPGAWVSRLGRLDRELRTYLGKMSLQLEPYLSLTLPAGTTIEALREARIALRTAEHGLREIVELRELHELEPSRTHAFGEQLEDLEQSLRAAFALLESQVFPCYVDAAAQSRAA